jgi:hypothetical protein
MLEEQGRSGKPLEQIVVDYGIIAENELIQQIAEYLGFPTSMSAQAEFNPELLSHPSPDRTACMEPCRSPLDGIQCDRCPSRSARTAKRRRHSLGPPENP